MIKYYLFKTNKKCKDSLIELFLQLGVSKRNIVFNSDNFGYLREDKTLFSKLQTIAPSIKEELGVNILFLMSHSINDVSNYCINELFLTFINQAISLFQGALYLASHKDTKLVNLLKSEFQYVDKVLIETMYAFINNDMNATLTAQDLYIHRNTFIYRLNRFIKETSLDVREFFNASYFLLFYNLKYFS